MPLPNPDATKYPVYRGFYYEECGYTLHDTGRHVSARTHQDILDIVTLLKQPHSRKEIREMLHELVNSLIDPAARLLLMIDFGNLQYGLSDRRQLHWREKDLKSYLQSYFCVPPALDHERVKLKKVFNARNLGRIAGVEIMPATTSPAACMCLPCRRNLAHTYPTFPLSDPTTRKRFRRLPFPFSLDPQVIQCGHLKTNDRQIESFTFWHDQLVILKQVFDEATPRIIFQWWYDRRNGCIEGALQVYGTFHSAH
ncbi:hypothetical protein K469DRAFT_724244 [Zopfia rhizophila CBS 207.26]|uniref:Uncharacterized protein n=1 Tax=Zopfia rhizophila CBS 207.26 TaxID=1314779 RepID=A0A6A6EE71_9PEZI|nr:hypothetical protein K469DRAFT_724244 [Zopfia rhizophila CBS 207.26]